MRRSRYTVTFDDGTKEVILAYSPASAVRYFEILKYQVASVEKGDYRIEARNAAIQSGGGFTVDQAALKEAIKTLGLKKPVKVRFDARVGKTSGNYRWRSGRHDIMLKSHLSVQRASSVLWHELTHAMQAERAMAQGKDWSLVANSQKAYSYKVRPIEVEARQMEVTMAHVPLCK